MRTSANGKPVLWRCGRVGSGVEKGGGCAPAAVALYPTKYPAGSVLNSCGPLRTGTDRDDGTRGERR